MTGDTPEEREVSFEKLAETSPITITKVDRDGNIIYANGGAGVVLGREKSEITDRIYDDPEWNFTDLEGNDFSPKTHLPYLQNGKRTNLRCRACYRMTSR